MTADTENCLFCKIIAKQIPTEILFEDDRVLAFQDINPQAPHHFLVIPKKHISTSNDIEADDCETVGYMQMTASKLATQLGFENQGFRTVMNCNQNGGQTVYHIHLHVLGGKPMGWPPYQETLKTALD
ncbi:MAG: histidine triad nucleotide-binding protein [Motiliproteus sp.]